MQLEYKPTPTAEISTAYAKQLQVVNPQYVALWRPAPMSVPALKEEEVQIGDVGVILDGGFNRLFHITRWGARISLGRIPPSHLEPLEFNPDEDVDWTDSPTSIQPLVPCSGSSRISWEHAPSSDHEKYPRFKIVKEKDRDDHATYVLVVAGAVEEAVVKQSVANKWRAYMHEHLSEWTKYVRETLGKLEIKSSDLVLVQGYVKAEKWAIASIPKRVAGEYILELDTTNGMHGSLMQGDTYVGSVESGGDYVRKPLSESVLASAERAGVKIPQQILEDRSCMRCVFMMPCGAKYQRLQKASKLQKPQSQSLFGLFKINVG